MRESATSARASNVSDDPETDPLWLMHYTTAASISSDADRVDQELRARRKAARVERWTAENMKLTQAFKFADADAIGAACI